MANLENYEPGRLNDETLVPHEVYRQWLRAKSEIYRAELEPVILGMLDGLARSGSNPQ